jgi:hypothetical protein
MLGTLELIFELLKRFVDLRIKSRIAELQE